MVLCSDPRRFVVLGFVSTSCPVAASALRCARPAVHPVKSYCEYQRRLSVQRRASERVCIFLHILRSSLCAGQIGKEFKALVHMCQKIQKYFVEYAPPNLKIGLPLWASGMGTSHTHNGKFGKGAPIPSALRSWARCRLIVSGSGARFWLACAVFALSGGLCFKAAPVVIFLSGVPESVKSLCHIMPKMRPNLPVVVGLVFSR